MTSLYDRPNDGGGVLHASWMPAQDSAWYAYRVYLWDSTDNPNWNPTKDDLDDLPHTRESRTGLRLPLFSRQVTAMVLRYRYQTRGSTGPQ